MKINQVIVDHIKNALRDMALMDIKRASSGNSKIGAFILASCFIDYMAGFAFGRKTTKHEYEAFVSHYLPPIYNPSKIYKDLRCGLVHNYSEGGSYWFVDNKPQLHGQIVNGRIIVNLKNFVDDLEKALNKLLDEIQSDQSKQLKAIARYNSIGLLCVGGLAPGRT
jgi:hypothetical protein